MGYVGLKISESPLGVEIDISVDSKAIAWLVRSAGTVGRSSPVANGVAIAMERVGGKNRMLISGVSGNRFGGVENVAFAVIVAVAVVSYTIFDAFPLGVENNLLGGDVSVGGDGGAVSPDVSLIGIGVRHVTIAPANNL